MKTSLVLPRVTPWPRPTRQEQVYEQPCYSFLGGTDLDGYALQNAKGSLASYKSPGSANQKLLKDVCRYGSAILFDRKKLNQSAAMVHFDLSNQSQVSTGFMCIGNRNEYGVGHVNLWILANATAWVIAKTQDDSENGPVICALAEKWFHKLLGNLQLLSYKGHVMHLGWRDTADMDPTNDDILAFLESGQYPPYSPKKWNETFNDAGVSVVYMFWAFKVLQDLGLMTFPWEAKSPEPTGLPVELDRPPGYVYQCAVPVLRISGDRDIDDWFRWAYRVKNNGAIEMQKVWKPKPGPRPSESEVPFVQVGHI